MNFIEQLKHDQNYTTTENGAIAYKSTMNACLDAFGSLGAMRHSEEADIIRTFSKAFAENKATAMRMLFYMRDIRGGQGCRRVFRVIFKWLAETEPKYVINNLGNILTFGRGDDMLCLLDTWVNVEVANWVKEQLNRDIKTLATGGKDISMLAKWVPSENTSSPTTKAAARKLIRLMRVSPRKYRKAVTTLRRYLNIVEQKMSAKEWTEIKYDAVPSKASMIYSDAFYKHDTKGYTKYISDIAEGKAKVNAGALYPYDIVHKVMSNRVDFKDRLLYDAMWKALPDYFAGKEETGICVVDTSGSMSGEPMEVAISLGMYCGDKCKGPFAGHFITFSDSPELVSIKGADIVEKVNNMERANWNMNTNLEAVFDLLLETAKKHRTSQSEMPNKLYIISDMQFDQARGVGYWYNRQTVPFMERMNRKYQAAGYEMPMIVYWNVRASKCGMFQTTFEGSNCCMVSGYSSSLFKAVIEGTTYEEEAVVEKDGTVSVSLKAKLDPMDMMLNTLGNERYDVVWVG